MAKVIWLQANWQGPGPNKWLEVKWGRCFSHLDACVVMFWECPNPQNQHGTSFQIGVGGHFLLKLAGYMLGSSANCAQSIKCLLFIAIPQILEGDFILLCHWENIRGCVGEAPFQGDRGTWVRGSIARPGVRQVPKGRHPLSASHGGRAGWQAELWWHQKPAALVGPKLW